MEHKVYYLEARNPTSGEVMDTLYIGECNYKTNKFNLNYFMDKPQNSEEPSFEMEQNSEKEIDTIYIEKIKNEVEDFDPETMDEYSALYDMKLVLYWIDSCNENMKQPQFVFVSC